MCRTNGAHVVVARRETEGTAAGARSRVGEQPDGSGSAWYRAVKGTARRGGRGAPRSSARYRALSATGSTVGMPNISATRRRSSPSSGQRANTAIPSHGGAPFPQLREAPRGFFARSVHLTRERGRGWRRGPPRLHPPPIPSRPDGRYSFTSTCVSRTVTDEPLVWLVKIRWYVPPLGRKKVPT